MVHHASRVGDNHLIDTLLALGIQVVKIMAPEHGFRGTSDAGEKVQNDTDSKNRHPYRFIVWKSKETLLPCWDIDIVLLICKTWEPGFIPTFQRYTMLWKLVASWEKNWLSWTDQPHVHYLDGPMLEDGYQSFHWHAPCANSLWYDHRRIW